MLTIARIQVGQRHHEPWSDMGKEPFPCWILCWTTKQKVRNRETKLQQPQFILHQAKKEEENLVVLTKQSMNMRGCLCESAKQYVKLVENKP